MTTQELYTLLRTETYNDHTRFGGVVSDYDFNGYNSMAQIASRIESDRKFDKSCKKNREYVNRYKTNGRN